jgi:thymidine phosphorylase
LTLELGARLLVGADVESSLESARTRLEQKIATGEALEKLAEMVRSHGGDLHAPRDVANQHVVQAHENGYLSRVNAERLGLAVIEMGGGRKKLGDRLDHSTGIEFLVRIGDKIETGQPIAHVFCNSKAAEYAMELVSASIGLSETQVAPPQLVVDSF